MTTQNSQGQEKDRPITQLQARPHIKAPSAKASLGLTVTGLALAGISASLIILQGPLADLTMKLQKNGIQSGGLFLTGLVFIGMGVLARHLHKTRQTQVSDGDALGDMGVAVHGVAARMDEIKGQVPPVHAEVQALRTELHQFAAQMESQDQQQGIFHIAGSVDKLAAMVDNTLKSFGQQIDSKITSISETVAQSSSEVREQFQVFRESQEGDEESELHAHMLERMNQLEEQFGAARSDLQNLTTELGKAVEEAGHARDMQTEAVQGAVSEAANQAAEKAIEMADFEKIVQAQTDALAEIQANSIGAMALEAENLTDLESEEAVVFANDGLDQAGSNSIAEDGSQTDLFDEIAEDCAQITLDSDPRSFEDIQLEGASEHSASVEELNSGSEDSDAANWNMPHTLSEPAVHQVEEQGPLQFIDSDETSASEEEPSQHKLAHALDHLFRADSSTEPTTRSGDPDDAPEESTEKHESPGQETSGTMEPSMDASDGASPQVHFDEIQETSLETPEPPPALPSIQTAPVNSSAYPVPVPLNQAEENSESGGQEAQMGSHGAPESTAPEQLAPEPTAPEPPAPMPYQAPKEPMRFRFPGFGSRG